jgi:predicted phosphodiesterase
LRVAVVSDLHGSLTPLEAVIEDIDRAAPDAVVHGGDLALMGPQPAEVVDRIRGLEWPGVVGNTDEVLWRPEERERQLERAPKIAPVIRVLFDEYAPVTRELLGDERMAWLRSLPPEHRIDDLVVTHAAPGDLWRAPMPDADDRELEDTYAALGPGTVAYGHVHRPYARRVSGELAVANAGSVAMPWDGDPRAAYLLVEDGWPEVVRVEYDVEREAASIERSGHPDAARLAEMRRRGRFFPPGWDGG